MTALVWAGEVSADARGKRVLSGRCVLAGGETGPFRCRCARTGDPDRLKPLQQPVVRPIRELEAESQDGNPG
jgi:hypothetical protein